MTVYFQATIELRAEFVQTFCQTMERTIPILEGAGWKLIGAYIQRTGRLHTAIDVWELEDYNHYDHALKVLTSHPQFAEIGAGLAKSIERETTVFMDRAPYAR